MSDVWVLDNYAVLALLQNEVGSDEVLRLLTQAQDGTARVLMTWVNVGEVFYIVARRWGREKALQTLGMLEATTMEIVDVDRQLALAAAEIKTRHPLAYADAFATALAMTQDATLVTGDPEFRNVEDIVRVHWLPGKPTG